MSSKKKITSQELSRAIFIDYEGNIDRAPSLLGWRVDGKSFASIVEEDFATCADRYRAKGITYTPHKSIAHKLLNQACEEDRVLVSWSEHDLRQISNVLPEQDQHALLSRYRNAITVARSWHYRTLGERAPEGTLSYFNRLLGFPIPLKYGTGRVGQGLRLIRNQLQKGRQYPELTPKARGSWIAVVKHNELDLRSMEFVLRSMLQVPLKGPNPDQMALTFVHESD
jgi:hypothetical protein